MGGCQATTSVVLGFECNTLGVPASAAINVNQRSRYLQSHATGNWFHTLVSSNDTIHSLRRVEDDDVCSSCNGVVSCGGILQDAKRPTRKVIDLPHVFNFERLIRGKNENSRTPSGPYPRYVQTAKR